jgi:uncharacterized membrane protein (DUF485 family)
MYVFVPPHRYDRIQQLRKSWEWTLWIIMIAAYFVFINNITVWFVAEMRY